MTSVSGLRILVVGAGVVGSAIALDLARHGAQATLCDAQAGTNASRVAAGMLAPAMEALLDPASAGHLDLLRQAQALWPGFAEDIDLQLHRCGSAFVGGSQTDQDLLAARMTDMGIGHRALERAAASRLADGLAAPGTALFTPEDWRLDASAALDALHGGARRLGVRFVDQPLQSLRDGPMLADGERPEVDAVVLATGLPPAGVEESLPELSSLRPIRGQLVAFPGCGPAQGAIIRAPGGYLVPGGAGLVVGATMEEGLNRLDPDPKATQRFADLAHRLYPQTAGCLSRPAVGVRSATPDGLPMVGASSQPGVFLALGARRNGWLLAPMMARVLRAALGGEKDPLLDPARVLSPA